MLWPDAIAYFAVLQKTEPLRFFGITLPKQADDVDDAYNFSQTIS